MNSSLKDILAAFDLISTRGDDTAILERGDECIAEMGKALTGLNRDLAITTTEVSPPVSLCF